MSFFDKAPAPSPALLDAEEHLTSAFEPRSCSFNITALRSPGDHETLLTLYRRQVLAHQKKRVEVARNMILRNFIENKQYIAANKFLHAVPLRGASATGELSIAAADSFESQNEAACFFLYAALIKTVLLDYGAAQDFIAEAMRKGPGETIPAFDNYAAKLSILIALLRGSIPPVDAYADNEALAPYVALVECFRLGEIQAFEKTIQAHEAALKADKTFLLAIRIRHNVFQMALRRINRSYSRISLQDIADKLELGSDEASDVHYIVMKAIRDGTIAGSIDVANADLVSEEIQKTYETTEPLRELQWRADANEMFRNQLERALDSERKAAKRDSPADEAMQKQIADSDKELVKALEEGVDSDMDDFVD